jgi:hypothetical protein
MLFSMNIDWSAIKDLGVRINKRTNVALEKAGEIVKEELNKATSRFRRSEIVGWDKHASEPLSGSFSLSRTGTRSFQITSSALYAKKQDEGGRIEMKPGGKRLLIPLPGITMKQVKELAEQKKTFAKRDTIFRRWGRGARAIAVTRKFVKIKSKHYVAKAEVRATPRIDAMFAEMYKGV